MKLIIALMALAVGFVPSANSEPPKREDDPARVLFAKSDTIVTGEFVSVGAASREAGVNHYHVEVKVDGVIKGDVKVGATIELAFVRIEPTAGDYLPILKEKNKALLFLKKLPNEKVFAPADPWFAFQHPQSGLIKELKELAK